jgi:cbb3-type cytochrome oxidase maturation protein
MSSLLVTLPITLLLAGVLTALVVRAAARGDFEDWEGPAARAALDDDTTPEHESPSAAARGGLGDDRLE